MKATMSRVLLTNEEMANVENVERFNAFMKLSVSNELWVQTFTDQLDIYGSDFAFSQYDLLFTVTANDKNLLLNVIAKPELLKIYKIENMDFRRSLEINSGCEIVIDNKDMIAVLDSHYFPEEIYGGAEALYYIQFER